MAHIKFHWYWINSRIRIKLSMPRGTRIWSVPHCWRASAFGTTTSTRGPLCDPQWCGGTECGRAGAMWWLTRPDSVSKVTHTLNVSVIASLSVGVRREIATKAQWHPLTCSRRQQWRTCRARGMLCPRLNSSLIESYTWFETIVLEYNFYLVIATVFSFHCCFCPDSMFTFCPT